MSDSESSSTSILRPATQNQPGLDSSIIFVEDCNHNHFRTILDLAGLKNWVESKSQIPDNDDELFTVSSWSFTPEKIDFKANLENSKSQPCSRGCNMSNILNQVENDAITSIYNFSSNKVWIIEFNVAFDVAKIFDREININGTNFRLEDANKVPDLRRYCTFRFHFLPSDFENHRLETFFNAVRIDGLKIEHITEEKYKDRPERKNGVRRVRISFPKEVKNIIGSLSGPTMMYGLKCLVSIVGQKQKCYFCDVEGHNIAKCPIKETLCEKCHQKGHLTQKCSIAEKLKALERKKIDYNDLYIDQEETQSIIGADQKENDDNMMPKTPGYQPTNFNDSPVNVRSNDQNETETFIQTKNEIKRISESDPNEKEFTEKESKKPLVVLENENDNTFESGSNNN
ncbi:hypothetical protein BpHYR1_021964 [Brachionus plicatilis]|uniref:CCHC-type domain-containing protein n=1 Tax=Brachionus plicatilis TaxID=10195 RepID=A0A3M7Q9U4_BRAPC|nr:hypothetical protein BpHYR1_021964 [Brachionus plicatilis]